jgi:hypothetical protein
VFIFLVCDRRRREVHDDKRERVLFCMFATVVMELHDDARERVFILLFTTVVVESVNMFLLCC